MLSLVCATVSCSTLQTGRWTTKPRKQFSPWRINTVLLWLQSTLWGDSQIVVDRASTATSNSLSQPISQNYIFLFCLHKAPCKTNFFLKNCKQNYWFSLSRAKHKMNLVNSESETSIQNHVTWLIILETNERYFIFCQYFIWHFIHPEKGID